MEDYVEDDEEDERIEMMKIQVKISESLLITKFTTGTNEVITWGGTALICCHPTL